jgi:hypothetical protein
MLNSSNIEHNQNLTTQKLFEHKIVHRFDNSSIKQNPSLRSLVQRLHGFGVMSIVGIDPRETLVGNLVVKINHRGFDT